ncbi:L-threonylcarbamoyladenylate synthase [Haloferula rosea]|uniref:Threonylcarbamoyl-AMP synthase n=1 Tax=Haloferula rosea TaxID=490093 RepID=A0A934VF75_9BACT|nr:L-threonylcarbamoyladenylate synthase [Haloferula rosea]MBK1826697.1 threonylcarbamoyl-AMP synthase [Haloferula rosea]
MDDAVREATALLERGEVVALPTETVYGLGADALNADAVAKVFAAKERPSFDPLIVHIGAYTDLEEVAQIPEDIAPTVKKLTSAFWPGPLTIILPKTDKVPDLVTSGLDTVAVRQSGNKIFRAIGKKLGRPIAAPSANRFGRISPTSASAVMKELSGRIPLIIDGGACRDGLESTIVRIEAGEKRPTIHILRPGPVTKKELQNFGKVILKKKRVTTDPEAPGQLESHYAPTTPLLLFDKPEDFQPEEGKRYGLLSYKGDPKAGYIDAHEWAMVEALSPGSGKLPEASVRLFHIMRVLDEAGLDAIVSEPVSETGLGQAIMDRLRRASANG